MVFDYDIIIIGAGPAGISAAGTLKKQGLKVALLEKTSQIGGTYYASMTNLLRPGPDSLLFSEIKNDISAVQGFALIDPTTLNDRYFGYIEGPDVELCLENNVFGAQIVLGSIFSVDVAGPEGKRTLSAKVFIDASGGAFLRTIRPRKPETTRKSITVLAGGMGLHNDVRQRITEITGHINDSLSGISVEISPTINKGLYHIRITGDGEEIRKALPAIMKQIEDFDGGSKDVFLIHGAGELYSEDIYTQEAKYVLEQNDVAQGRRFEDSVIEGDTGSGLFYVPYRSLLPVGVNNLLLCGRSIGARRELAEATDTVKTAYATGQSAALAALYCIKNNLPLEQADTDAISSPFIGFSQNYLMDEDPDIYIENIDVEDLVELAPEEEEPVSAMAGQRPVEEPDDQEWESGAEPEVPEYDGAPEYAAPDGEAMEEAPRNELPEEDAQDDDKPFFTEENLIRSIDNPLYDLLADDIEGGVNAAQYEKAAQDTEEETDKDIMECDEKETGGVLTGFGEMKYSAVYEPEPEEPGESALAKSIEQAAQQKPLQGAEQEAQEEDALEFPQEDIIDKLPSYVLFDEENNAIDFSKADQPQKAPEEAPQERNSVDELLSLLDVLPDQLPEGLYDFLKENSKSRKAEEELE